MLLLFCSHIVALNGHVVAAKPSQVTPVIGAVEGDVSL